MKVGYARVSTLDQNLDLQTDALKKEGCKEIFEDHAGSSPAPGTYYNRLYIALFIR
ncbi:MAG: recombinase family protein [Candidatus Marinimicrobia bacterium]|nr:recombinase family protein [Candidatus Neomarinimicrobiota bacterium]